MKMSEYLGNFMNTEEQAGGGSGKDTSVHVCVGHVTVTVCNCNTLSGSGCAYIDGHDTHF